MSEDFKFIKVPNQIVELNLNGNEVLLILRILRVAGFEREFYESRSKTSEELGCNKDLISACIKELQKLQILSVTEGKRGLPYRLKINHPDQWQRRVREATNKKNLLPNKKNQLVTNKKNLLPNKKNQLPNKKNQFVYDPFLGSERANVPENPVGVTRKTSYYKQENLVTPSTLDEVDLIEVDLIEVEIFAEHLPASAPEPDPEDWLAMVPVGDNPVEPAAEPEPVTPLPLDRPNGFSPQSEMVLYKPDARTEVENGEPLFIEAESVDETQSPRKTRKQPRGEKKAVDKGKGLPTPVTEAWRAYSEAFKGKYGVEPIRNGRVMGQVKLFIDRVGQADAPDILRFYLQQHDRYTVQNGHTVGIALQQAEKLANGYRGAKMMTEKEARRIDEKQTTANILEAYEARKEDYFEF